MSINRLELAAQNELATALHEMTTEELLYFMAKLLEELTKRRKDMEMIKT